MKQKHTEAYDADAIRWRNTLRWRLVFFVFLIMLLSCILTALTYILILLFLGEQAWVVALTVRPILLVLVLLFACSVFGLILAGFFGKYYLRPLKSLIHATHEVKKGNFKTRVKVDEFGEGEMDRLIKSFNEMVEELDGIELLRNDFINNFSHEFKTPIVSIRGFARELQAGNLSEEKKMEYAGIIAEEADRLARLASSVLELSKLENMQILSGKTVFSLDEQIRQCILLQEASWSKKEIEMIPELESVEFYSNEELLSHVWSNLISNAIKFTPKGKSVSVSLQTKGDRVVVSVKDTGIGMTPEVQAHVFEKFYQGDPSHHGSGYGIGLTMVKRALTLCGGEISVESILGEGSTFTVILPCEAPQTKEA